MIIFFINRLSRFSSFYKKFKGTPMTRQTFMGISEVKLEKSG
jgi:hypothetical protein